MRGVVPLEPFLIGDTGRISLQKKRNLINSISKKKNPAPPASPRQSIGVLGRRHDAGVGGVVVYLFETFVITGTYVAFAVLEVLELVHLLAVEGVDGADGARQRNAVLEQPRQVLREAIE